MDNVTSLTSDNNRIPDVSSGAMVQEAEEVTLSNHQPERESGTGVSGGYSRGGV